MAIARLAYLQAPTGSKHERQQHTNHPVPTKQQATHTGTLAASYAASYGYMVSWTQR
jgi:hypothetical protein